MPLQREKLARPLALFVVPDYANATGWANEPWTSGEPSTTMTLRPTNLSHPAARPTKIAMSKSNTAVSAAVETDHERFARILLRSQFKPLKAVLDTLDADVAALHTATLTTNSYQLFLGKLGYRVILAKQIREQDCYARLGRAGGIRAMLPVHDTANYSTRVTLVNFDSTLSATPDSVEFFDEQLAEFKTQLMSRSGNAA
jgi:hypothetical protein